MSVRQLAALKLTCHPATPCAAVRGIDVEVHWQDQPTPASTPNLLLVYVVTGQIDALRIPAASASPAPTDGLWQHTCFEAFMTGDDPQYREFNFSPSGDWAAYRFGGERIRDPHAEASNATVPPRIITSRSRDLVFTLGVELSASQLPASAHDAPLTLGLTAVIETTDGALSYWALHHPADKPDFHHRSGWTLRLPTLKDSPA